MEKPKHESKDSGFRFTNSRFASVHPHITSFSQDIWLLCIEWECILKSRMKRNFSNANSFLFLIKDTTYKFMQYSVNQFRELIAGPVQNVKLNSVLFGGPI